MRLTAIAASLLLALVSACQSQRGREHADREDVSASSIEQQISQAVNVERTSRGLRALDWSNDLLTAARDHSQRMSQAGFFSHTDPDRGSLPERLRTHGIRYRAAGENLFALKGPEDPVKAAIQGWVKSPEHGANMLSDRFRSTAVGVARAADGTIYVTQVFLHAGSQ